MICCKDCLQQINDGVRCGYCIYQRLGFEGTHYEFLADVLNLSDPSRFLRKAIGVQSYTYDELIRSCGIMRGGNGQNPKGDHD